jgi:hypothetical protein
MLLRTPVTPRPRHEDARGCHFDRLAEVVRRDLNAGRGGAKGRLSQPLHFDLAAALRVDRAGTQAEHDGKRLQKAFHGNLLVILVCGFSRA